VKSLSALLTRKRLTLWGLGLLLLSWAIYVHTMMVPGLFDRAKRFKGTDHIAFYVMGSLARDGRMDALYDPQANLDEGRRRIDRGLDLYMAHPNYGPQIAVAFAPLAALPFSLSLTIFLAFTALCYALSVWLVWRELPALRGDARLVALLAAASPLFLALFRYAQLSAISLLFWSLAFVAFRRQRSFAAGLAIGCLAFKPQMGIVIAIALLAARDWRAVAGASVTAVGQLAFAWLVAGSAAMLAYFHVLWTLLLNPALVQAFPSEVHSVRGFAQLLIPSPAIVSALSLVALAIAVVAAVRTWRSAAPLELRWAMVMLLTLLGSPHLLTYDLLLLTLPLLVLADWAVRNHAHPRQPLVALLLVGLYLSPFSSHLARLTHVQLSVLAMAAVAWCVYDVCRKPTPTLPPVTVS
jgi:alpha-1,2-mannosyltransferase